MIQRDGEPGIYRLPRATWWRAPGLSRGFTHAVLTLAIIMALSCCDVEDPLEELPPDTHITSGPEDGAVMTEPPVTFQWEGSNELVEEFSYRCSPYQEEWSPWSLDGSITFYLDEGEYIFEVKGQYEPENEDDTPAQRAFSVDFPDPGMLLKPFKQEVLLNQEFTISVIAHEVEDVMLAHLVLEFDASQLQALEVIPGEVFRRSNPPMFLARINDTEGIIDINMSTVGTKPPRIEGTAEIATIRFRSLSVGEGGVDIDSGSEFRNSENGIINIASQWGSVVEVVAE